MQLEGEMIYFNAQLVIHPQEAWAGTQVGTWRQGVMQKPWRIDACWRVSLGLLSLPT